MSLYDEKQAASTSVSVSNAKEAPSSVSDYKRLIDPDTEKPVFDDDKEDQIFRDTWQYLRRSGDVFAGCHSVGDFVMTFRMLTSMSYDPEHAVASAAAEFKKSPYYCTPGLSTIEFYESKFATAQFLKSLANDPRAAAAGLWPPPATAPKSIRDAAAKLMAASPFGRWQAKEMKQLPAEIYAKFTPSDWQWRFQMSELCKKEKAERHLESVRSGHRPHQTVIVARKKASHAVRRDNASTNKTARIEAAQAAAKQRAIAELARLKKGGSL